MIREALFTMAANLNFSSITTDEYRNMKGFEITYGFFETRFGPCIIGLDKAKEQLCYIAFHEEGKDNAAIDNLQRDWPNAVLNENKHTIKSVAKQIFDEDGPDQELQLLLKGTEFQVNVWKELTKIKPGATTSYEEIAKAVGKPSAIRAVANVIAKNRLAYVIPCHRVIQKSGNVNKYRWGSQRKKEMLKYEKAL